MDELKKLIKGLMRTLNKRNAEIEVLRLNSLTPKQKEELDKLLLDAKNVLEEKD